MDNSEAVYNGISINMVVFIVFLVLKLTKVINWSWWWITAPLWIPTGLALAIFIICFAVLSISEVVKMHKDNKKDR